MSRETRVIVALGLLGLVLAGGAAAITATSAHEKQAVLMAVLYPVVALSFVASGSVAWWRRPGNRTGLLMAAVGFVLLLGALSDANEAWVYTIGVALGGLFLAVFLNLLLVYPGGSLLSRGERIFVAAGYTIALLAGLLPALFKPKLDSDCDNCPQSAFLVVDSSTAGWALNLAFTIAGLALFLCVAWLLLRRWLSATEPTRRTMGPVYLSGGVSLVFIIATFAASGASQQASDVLFYVAFAWFAAVPLFFLVGLLRTRLARVAAARMLLETPDEPTLAEVEAGLRRALGDPSLELLVWEPQERCYLDSKDRARDEPRETVKRTVTRIESEGRPLAAIVHDVALNAEPDLLAEVVATARLALQKDRGLRALRRSEARVRALLDALPDVMIRFRRDGTYLAIRGDPRSLVRPREEMIGRNVRDFISPDLARPLLECAGRALDSGEMQSIEFDLELRGELRHFEARMVPSSGDEIVSIVRDTTDRERNLAELRASRTRLLEAQGEERRRLERNLHDGAQQRLVALSLALRLARAKLAKDPDSAAQILEGAGEELAVALAELRELARGIHPAMLTDRGLGPALESLAARAPLPVELLAVPDERLPAPVEEAAFYVVSEALANIGKYAHASVARIGVTRHNGRAVVEVDDDGVGGADPTRGSGLRGLVDRVEALDGSFEVVSPAGGGTRVRAEIPCRE